LLFCLSLSNLSATYAPGGSAPISSRGALEAAFLMPQGLCKQPDLPRQLAHCPKKSFHCPQNGQSRTKFKHKPNQTCHSKPGGYAACRQSQPCYLASTLIRSSILFPQTKNLPEYWGKCVQIYRTTTEDCFNRLNGFAPFRIRAAALSFPNSRSAAAKTSVALTQYNKRSRLTSDAVYQKIG
ncbi:MAG: hypothetical protein OXE52_15435, partial [Chloroflexi bacterium]|nr:hypothetical protein [Chloroflexota bacterium]